MDSGSGGRTGDICSFAIEGALSEEIPTVGVIAWSTDLEGVTAARIEFSLDDPQTDERNVGGGGSISADGTSALMLGLKPERSYTYRIVATSGEATCVSSDHALVTHADPRSPTVTRTLGAAAASRANGFIVHCDSRGGHEAFIIDMDGDVVWRVDSPPSCSRALMDWDGETMWMMELGVGGSTSSDVRRVRMDGREEEQITGIGGAHHDFAVLPGGTTAWLVSTDQPGDVSDLVERSPDGTLRTVARLDGNTYLAAFDVFHANAIRYYVEDDSYTVSDLYVPAIIKLNRQGEVQWQLGECREGSSPQCASADVAGTHGHQVLDNGNILFISSRNGSGASMSAPSPVYEYSFSQEEGQLTATLVWSHATEPGTWVLGDVQRLPNGNTLVTYSTEGFIHEVSPTGEIVQSLSADGLGYAHFRETLYGSPSSPSR